MVIVPSKTKLIISANSKLRAERLDGTDIQVVVGDVVVKATPSDSEPRPDLVSTFVGRELERQ